MIKSDLSSILWRRRDAECCENTSSFIFIRRKLQKECSGVVSWTRSYLPCSMKMQQILSWTQLPPILFSLSLQNFPHSNQNSWGPEQVILEPSTVFFSSFFRRNITAQGRETVPKRMNFGKIPNGLWPHTLILGKSYCNLFPEKPSLMPCIMVQNLQYDFLDWKWPPTLPLELFQKFIRFGSVTCS